MFGVLPHTLKRLPLSEFQVLYRYYMKERADMGIAAEKGADNTPTDGIIIE